MSATMALYLYRCIYVGFIVFASAKTLAEGWPAKRAGAAATRMDAFIRVLAATEILVALAFLWLPAQLWTGAALIAIFVIATGIDLAHRGVPVRFAYYSATAALLVFLDLELRNGLAA